MKARVMMIAMMCSLTVQFVNAQNVVEQMNEVKGNADYCYGEGAHTDSQQAFELALNELVSELSKKAGVQVDKDKLREKAAKLERKRGEQIRMLVYVPLAQFKTAQNPSVPNVTSRQDPVPIPEKVQTPAVVQPVPVQSREPASLSTTSNERQPLNIPAKRIDYSKAKDVLNQMKMVKHTNAMKKLLLADMEGGLIKNCGTPSDVKDIDNVYWWVFRKGEPMQFVAVLSPVNANGKRDNIETGEEQTLLDFQNSEYGTVWFTLP